MYESWLGEVVSKMDFYGYTPQNGGTFLDLIKS